MIETCLKISNTIEVQQEFITLHNKEKDPLKVDVFLLNTSSIASAASAKSSSLRFSVSWPDTLDVSLSFNLYVSSVQSLSTCSVSVDVKSLFGDSAPLKT